MMEKKKKKKGESFFNSSRSSSTSSTKAFSGDKLEFHQVGTKSCHLGGSVVRNSIALYAAAFPRENLTREWSTFSVFNGLVNTELQKEAQ